MARLGRMTPIDVRMIRTVQPVDQIVWSGHTWDVRNGVGPPGPTVNNTWGGTTANVEVSGTDLLMKIANVDGTWKSAEIRRQGGSLGYGRYRWTYTVGAAGLDIKPVLGLFTYESDTQEIDIETSKWNYAPEISRQWYTNQPSTEMSQADHVLSAATPYTAEYVWEAGQIYWRTVDANDALLGEHVVRSGIPPEGAEQVRINLWLIDAAAPTDAQPLTVTVHSFDFTADVTHALTAADGIAYNFSDQYEWGLHDGADIVSGELVLPCGSTYSVAYTGSIFDMRNSFAQIEVSGMPTFDGNLSQEALWFVRHDADNYILMFVSGGSMAARLRQGGVNSSNVNIGTWNATTHRYWRVEHSGTTITFRTSPDGWSWNTAGSLETTLTSTQLSATRVRLESGYYSTETNPGDFKVTQLGLSAWSRPNVAPSAAAVRSAVW